MLLNNFNNQSALTLNKQLGTSENPISILKQGSNDSEISQGQNQGLVLSNQTSIPIPLEEVFSIENLTEVNRDRYYSLLVTYNEETSKSILNALNQYSINTWGSVCAKIDFIIRNEHLDPLYETIIHEIEGKRATGGEWSIPEIIRLVGSLRSQSGLPSFRTSIAKQSVSVFLQCHMADAIHSAGVNEKSGRSVVIGYKPTINLVASN